MAATITNLLFKIAELKRQGYEKILVNFFESYGGDDFWIDFVGPKGKVERYHEDYAEPWVHELAGALCLLSSDDGSYGDAEIDLATLVVRTKQFFRAYEECRGVCGFDPIRDPNSFCSCDLKEVDGDTAEQIFELASVVESTDEFFALGIAITTTIQPLTEEAYHGAPL